MQNVLEGLNLSTKPKPEAHKQTAAVHARMMQAALASACAAWGDNAAKANVSCLFVALIMSCLTHPGNSQEVDLLQGIDVLPLDVRSIGMKLHDVSPVLEDGEDVQEGISCYMGQAT